jgi:hypothetical protein
MTKECHNFATGFGGCIQQRAADLRGFLAIHKISTETQGEN